MGETFPPDFQKHLWANHERMLNNQAEVLALENRIIILTYTILMVVCVTGLFLAYILPKLVALTQSNDALTKLLREAMNSLRWKQDATIEKQEATIEKVERIEHAVVQPQ